VVPFTPETVQVLGAVMNPHAFIFHPGAKAGEYLHLAGGTNRDADSKRIIILRADGTTVSRHDANSSVFARSFNDLRLYPGDSIVVPEKSLHLSPMTQFLAWTSALSQSSLPAVEATALAR
jgi:protein involved in polysaccharide export with SLBB domain